MLDKYTINLDKSFLPLFERLVAAFERIAPPPQNQGSIPAPIVTEEESDLIDYSDEEYTRKSLQWQLDDLVETLNGGGNEEEIARLTELKRRIAEADFEKEESELG